MGVGVVVVVVVLNQFKASDNVPNNTVNCVSYFPKKFSSKKAKTITYSFKVKKTTMDDGFM